MKRENFIKIIRLRSKYKITPRKGNYKLPSGSPLSKYVAKLVKSELELDGLLVRSNGDLCYGKWGYYDEEEKCNVDCFLMPEYPQMHENCSCKEMKQRINDLIYDVITHPGIRTGKKE